MIRIEIAVPGSHFFKGDSLRYLQTVTSHGLVMVFFVVIPLIFGFLANFFVPYHVGAKDVAFPRLNSFGFWVQILGYILTARVAFFRKSMYNYYDTYTLYKNLKKERKTNRQKLSNFFLYTYTEFLNKYNYLLINKKQKPLNLVNELDDRIYTYTNLMTDFNLLEDIVDYKENKDCFYYYYLNRRVFYKSIFLESFSKTFFNTADKSENTDEYSKFLFPTFKKNYNYDLFKSNNFVFNYLRTNKVFVTSKTDLSTDEIKDFALTKHINIMNYDFFLKKINLNSFLHFNNSAVKRSSLTKILCDNASSVTSG